MRHFYTLLASLLISSISYAGDFSENGIQLHMPDEFSAPSWSKGKEHERAISFTKKYPPGKNATLLIVITAQQLPPDFQEKIGTIDRMVLLEHVLDERLAMFSEGFRRGDTDIKIDPVQAITLAGEPGAEKTLTAMANGKAITRIIAYSAMVDFRMFEFHLMLTGDVPDTDIQALTEAIENVRFDISAIHQLNFD